MRILCKCIHCIIKSYFTISNVCSPRNYRCVRNPGRDMLILFNNSFPRLIMSWERLIMSWERLIKSSERVIMSSERLIKSSERLIKSWERDIMSWE